MCIPPACSQSGPGTPDEEWNGIAWCSQRAAWLRLVGRCEHQKTCMILVGANIPQRQSRAGWLYIKELYFCQGASGDIERSGSEAPVIHQPHWSPCGRGRLYSVCLEPEDHVTHKEMQGMVRVRGCQFACARLLCHLWFTLCPSNITEAELLQHQPQRWQQDPGTWLRSQSCSKGQSRLVNI